MPWTKVAKPTESSITTGMGDGSPFGLLIAITSVISAATSSITTGWTDISKPTSSTWTAITKPTSSVWNLVAKPTT